MRYEYVGYKVAYAGKTLWEIVGNLKNFGVGRLVRKNDLATYPELSFMKIVKVQPLPPSKKPGENRPVMIWVDEICRGAKKSTQQLIRDTTLTKYELIPKIEEEEYLRKAAELKPPEIHVEKYMSWPPLYKKLWEEQLGNRKLPKLKTAITHVEGYNYIIEDTEKKPETSSLYRTDQTVDELYKEMVRLKEIVMSHKNVEQ